MAATTDPIMTLGIIKKIIEIKLLSDGGDPRIVNILKPITAINPPRNPPIIPHLNRLFNLLKRICFILPKNRRTDKAEIWLVLRASSEPQPNSLPKGSSCETILRPEFTYGEFIELSKG